MSDSETKVWGIHAIDGSLFLRENVVAIGWHEMGDISAIAADREALKAKYATAYPEKTSGAAATSAGQLYRFINECKIGDYVIFPSKSDRKIHIGKISGEAEYVPSAGNFPHRRAVEWLKKGIARSAFSQGALYEIGSAMTFFSVRNYAEEFLAALVGTVSVNKTEDETEEISLQADSIIEQTKDYVLKQLSSTLKGYPLEDVVADLLKAMGYKVTQSAKGGDRGIDIVCYKDEFPPRIVVQVKSHDKDVAEKDVQALKGAMNNNDYGLFVALSDYTANAQKYLETHTEIRGINGSDLVDLLLQYYEKLSDKNRALIPLRKVYIPVVQA